VGPKKASGGKGLELAGSARQDLTVRKIISLFFSISISLFCQYTFGAAQQAKAQQKSFLKYHEVIKDLVPAFVYSLFSICSLGCLLLTDAI
jgi:hypothetical protein